MRRWNLKSSSDGTSPAHIPRQVHARGDKHSARAQAALVLRAPCHVRGTEPVNIVVIDGRLLSLLLSWVRRQLRLKLGKPSLINEAR